MYRVLVVDDDPAVRALLAMKLHAEGLECRQAASARDGLAACASFKPDAVVLDVHLPDADGIEVCRRLKADPALRHIPILLVTGEAVQVESRTAGLDAGADDYVIKPFNVREVYSRIERLIRAAQAR